MFVFLTTRAETLHIVHIIYVIMLEPHTYV